LFNAENIASITAMEIRRSNQLVYDEFPKEAKRFEMAKECAKKIEKSLNKERKHQISSSFFFFYSKGAVKATSYITGGLLFALQQIQTRSNV